MSKEKGSSGERWQSLLLITSICLLSHGLLVGQLGFNWDDWFCLLVGHLQGFKGFLESASIDRPAMGLYTGASYVLFGLNPLVWHLFAWVARWLAVILFWWILRTLWPQRRLETTLAALLFCVYPGYRMHPLPVFSILQYVTMNLCLFSFGMMSWAQQVKRRGALLEILALTAIPFYALSFEYYAGLDLLRPLILWHLGKEKVSQKECRFRWTLRHWFPYLFVLLAVMVYRVFIFKPNRNLEMYSATDVGALATRWVQAVQDPLLLIVQFGFRVWRGLLEAAVLGWAPILEFMRLNFENRSTWLAWLLFGFSSFLVLMYLRKESFTREDDLGEARWTKGILVGGFIAVLCGLLVIVAVKGPPLAEGKNSRYMFIVSIGASLIGVGFVRFLFKKSFQNLILSFLIGASVGANFLNGWAYKRDWELQRSFWWQLAWRAPGIKPGTLLFVDIPPNPLSEIRSSYEIAAPANFLYHPGKGTQPALWGLDLHNPQFLKLLQRGGLYAEEQRSLLFQGDVRDALVLHMEKKWTKPTGPREPCLKVLRPDEPVPEHFASAAYSNIDRINPSNENSFLPECVLGKEPPHRWCYFYQRMELFRQRRDWKGVVRLAEEAESKGFRPEEPTEGLVGIEGYFRTGEVDKGKRLLTSLLESSPESTPAIRYMVSRLRVSEGGKMGSLRLSIELNQLIESFQRKPWPQNT